MPSIAMPASALVLLATALTAGTAVAQTAPAPSLNLSPSQFPGVLTGRVQVGPMTLLNGTQANYRVRAFGVLLGQRRDGGLFVRDDSRSRARTRRILVVGTGRFDLSPGEARSVFSRIRRMPRSGSFFGGVLFQATPRERPQRPRQIRSILQLTASVLLNPTPSRRRLRFSTEAIRVESVRGKRLRLLVPVLNRGNTYQRVAAIVRVRDRRGKVVGHGRTRAVRILPGAVVDLAAGLRRRLSAGSYTLSATLRGTGRRVSARGSMRLFGVNEVATRKARLTAFKTSTAYKGVNLEVQAAYRNTGNIAYAPDARVLVRPIRGGSPGPVVATHDMRVERVEPGKTGRIQAKFPLPTKAGSYQLTTRLLAGRRTVDSKDMAVTPTDQPPITARATDWVTGHAVALVLVLLAVVAFLLAALRFRTTVEEKP